MFITFFNYNYALARGSRPYIRVGFVRGTAADVLFVVENDRRKNVGQKSDFDFRRTLSCYTVVHTILIFFFSAHTGSRHNVVVLVRGGKKKKKKKPWGFDRGGGLSVDDIIAPPVRVGIGLFLIPFIPRRADIVYIIHWKTSLLLGSRNFLTFRISPSPGTSPISDSFSPINKRDVLEIKKKCTYIHVLCVRHLRGQCCGGNGERGNFFPTRNG